MLVFSKDALIKSDSKDIYNVTNDFYSSQNPEKQNVSRFPQKYWVAQLFSTLIIIRNVSWAANQNIKMISEESCDTEDWSNDDANSDLITGVHYI